MAAFEAATARGATHVETDAHATRDGVAVAFHDGVLDRVSDGTGAVREQTWDSLRGVRVGGAAAIPRLTELLSTWPDLRVNIDVKDWSAVTPVADAIRRCRAEHRVCVTSFDDRRTLAVRRLLGPQVATSPGPRGVVSWQMASLHAPGAARWARPGGPSVVAFQVPSRAGPLPVVTRASVRQAHRWGMHVHVWTINDPARMHRLLDLGVDGLITDRLDLAQQVVADRRSDSSTGPGTA